MHVGKMQIVYYFCLRMNSIFNNMSKAMALHVNPILYSLEHVTYQFLSYLRRAKLNCMFHLYQPLFLRFHVGSWTLLADFSAYW